MEIAFPYNHRQTPELTVFEIQTLQIKRKIDIYFNLIFANKFNFGILFLDTEF